MENVFVFIFLFIFSFPSLASTFFPRNEVCSNLFPISQFSGINQNPKKANTLDSRFINTDSTHKINVESSENLFELFRNPKVPSLDIVTNPEFLNFLNEHVESEFLGQNSINKGPKRKFLVQMARMLKKGEFTSSSGIAHRNEAINDPRFREGIKSIINYIARAIENSDDSIDPSTLRELLEGLKSLIGSSTQHEKENWYSPWYNSICKKEMSRRLLHYIFFEPEYINGLSEPFIIKTRDTETGNFGHPNSFMGRVLSNLSFLVGDPLFLASTFDLFLNERFSYYQATRLSELALLLSQDPDSLISDFFKITSGSRSNRSRFIKDRNHLDPSLYIDDFDLLLLARAKNRSPVDFRNFQADKYEHSAHFFLSHYLLGLDIEYYNQKIDLIVRALNLQGLKKNDGKEIDVHLTRTIAEDLFRGAIINQFLNPKEMVFTSGGNSFDVLVRQSIQLFNSSLEAILSVMDKDERRLIVNNPKELRVVSRTIELFASMGLDIESITNNDSLEISSTFWDYRAWIQSKPYRSSPSFAPYLLGIPYVQEEIMRARQRKESQSVTSDSKSNIDWALALFTFGQPVP